VASNNSGARAESPGAADGRLKVVADGFASTREASEFLSVSRSKLYALMDSGDLQFAKFGKSRRVPWQSLRAFAARCLVG
jgi:excisionase family DNA binding protein